MCNISIGKNEIIKLKNREREVLNELNNDVFFKRKQGNTLCSLKTLRLQKELKVLQTKLKLLDADCNEIA